ncbi:MAG TPA: hypothetical protein VNK24_06060 [Elusimicrobiota bacterium]|nr:hypothetical protein [Elusimicrobiota bacterium]
MMATVAAHWRGQVQVGVAMGARCAEAVIARNKIVCSIVVSPCFFST